MALTLKKGDTETLRLLSWKAPEEQDSYNEDDRYRSNSKEFNPETP